MAEVALEIPVVVPCSNPVCSWEYVGPGWGYVVRSRAMVFGAVDGRGNVIRTGGRSAELNIRATSETIGELWSAPGEILKQLEDFAVDQKAELHPGESLAFFAEHLPRSILLYVSNRAHREEALELRPDQIDHEAGRNVASDMP